jgi:ribosome-binding ATPase
VPLICGLIGLPNAGKSTLFRAITAAAADIAPYPFTTIAPNVGVVPVPDPRLEQIAAITHPDRVVPATLQLVDIAGLVRGAHRGEGLGNQFLAHIREVDALLHVVRGFGGPVAHVEGDVDPVRDIGIVDTELLLADLATAERARAQVIPRARTGDRAAREEEAVLAALEAHLAAERPARTMGMDGPAAQVVGRLHLLTCHPVLFIVNLDDADPDAPRRLAAVEDYAARASATALGLFGKLELELSELGDGEARQFLDALGLRERGLPRLVRACHALLGLRTFFSVASAEVRAWDVPAGTRAPQAAGGIHSDMERGFIRAEVIAARDLVACGSLAAARDRGLLRLEGRDYEIRDGDVVTFRFG